MVDSSRSTVRAQFMRGRQPTAADLDAWVRLKENLAVAEELCERDEIPDALPLLREVIRECHRFMILFPNPTVILVGTSAPESEDSAGVLATTNKPIKRNMSFSSLSDTPQSGSAQKNKTRTGQPELPTAFHTSFGIALFLMGNIIAQDASLALPGEPNTASTYWLASLDVFETAESLPSLLDGKDSQAASEDWRMAVHWGRTLVRLAEETLPSSQDEHVRSHYGERQRHIEEMSAYQTHPGPFSRPEPTWPKDSPFHTIAMSRPPTTRRMSLYSASSHDILLLAMDQFSRGIFHMPHAYCPLPNASTPSHHLARFAPVATKSSSLDHNAAQGPSTPSSPSSPTSEGSGQLRPRLTPLAVDESSLAPRSPNSIGPVFSRPKELFTIASEVLGVTERLPSAESRQYWANWADSMFNQMKMEADIDLWRGPVIRARGHCWLIIGSAQAEPLEEALERGESAVVNSEEAEEARESLTMAITLLERSRVSATATHDEDSENVSPLLAEALITLANITNDVVKREQLYALAKTEGGDEVDLDLDGSTPSPRVGGAMALLAQNQNAPLGSDDPIDYMEYTSQRTDFNAQDDAMNVD